MKTVLSELHPHQIRAIEIDTRSIAQIAACYACTTQLIQLIKINGVKRGSD